MSIPTIKVPVEPTEWEPCLRKKGATCLSQYQGQVFQGMQNTMTVCQVRPMNVAELVELAAALSGVDRDILLRALGFHEVDGGARWQT